MYGRYNIDWEPEPPAPPEPRERRREPPERQDAGRPGGLASLLSRFGGMDKGDLLLLAVLAFLLFEGEDMEIVILLALVLLVL